MKKKTTKKEFSIFKDTFDECEAVTVRLTAAIMEPK